MEARFSVMKIYSSGEPKTWCGLSEAEALKIAKQLNKEKDKGDLRIERTMECARCKEETDWKISKKYCLECSRQLTNVRQREAKKKNAMD